MSTISAASPHTSAPSATRRPASARCGPNPSASDHRQPALGQTARRPLDRVAAEPAGLGVGADLVAGGRGRAIWVVSFLDRSTPAWFTAWIDRSSYRTLRLEMVAVAHFMHDRDGAFNAPLSIEQSGA